MPEEIEEKIKAQHDKGKLTARERINLLFDKANFEEINPFVTHQCTDFGIAKKKILGDSVITGFGKISGRKVFIFAQDFTVFGGSLSKAGAEKICKVMDLAAETGAPIIGLLDSGGARIQEGVDSLDGYGQIFNRNTLYSGVIPQISVILGPAAGGAVYSPAITDFVLMVRRIGQMYIAGPEVIKMATGESASSEELGGALVHSQKSGNCHFVAESEEECFQTLKRLLGFLPQNNRETPPFIETKDDSSRMEADLAYLAPKNTKEAYDMKKIIAKVVDNEDFLEVQKYFARNIIVGFARLSGKTIGVVAQQPMFLAGVIDIDASDKAARFIRFCDCFSIPLVTFVDVPGFLPGIDQEHRGIIRHGAKLLFAYAEATVPKISIIVRKAYGGAYVAMSSKSLRSDINYAWPTAEIAVMGPEAAVNILYKKEIARSENPEKTSQDLVKKYRKKFTNPYVAASRGYLEDVIDPKTTRPKLIKALAFLENKKEMIPWKKHGNIPL